MKLLVLDGNSILNRAFYGIKLLTTKSGQYTNAIFGFMNILLKLEENEKPDEIAIAFDLKAPTFRHVMYDQYKAHRKGMPEELAAQLPVLKELLDLLGYVEVSKEGYEADDILGTLANATAARGDKCLLATGDRDSLQLVQPGVAVLLTTTRMGKGETVRMDEAAIMEKYGVTPKQLIETKALMGDASDNIPGVPGVGEKTAFALIHQFHSVEGVYENIENPAIKPGVRNKLKENKDMADISYKLAKINCEVPVDTHLGAYKKSAPKAAEAAALLSRLEMHSILDRLGLEPGPSDFTKTKAQQNLETITPQPLGQYEKLPTLLAPVEQHWVILQNQNLFTTQPDSEVFIQLLADSAVPKKVFDAKELHRIALKAGKQARNILFDAKLASYLLNPSASEYSLTRLCAEYSVQALFHCEEIPGAGQFSLLFDQLEKDCEEAGMLSLLQDIELPLSEVLASMELAGIALNAQGLREFGDQLQAELQKQQASVFQRVGYEFNLNSPKQLGEALFDTLGLPHRKKTKSGWSTDAETLESLRKYDPVIDTILLYRTYQKLNSTYVEGLLKVVAEDGRIHSTFNQTETRTGRISSNEPNMQNIPIRTELGSKLREFFIAPEGFVFADADYSQIELRILADISKDEAMQNTFRQGEDIHRATAAKVNNLPLEMVTPQMRSAAKAVNFGIVYGIGAYSLSKDIGVSVKEAGDFIKNYLDNFPGVRRYMETTVEQGKEKGYVETLFGRRRPLPELSSSNRVVQALGQRMAMNTPIQGTAADIIKLAMIKVFQRLRNEGLQSRLVLQVHDELIVETLEHEKEQVALILQQEMQGAANLSVPLVAVVHTGKNWLLAKGED